MEKPLPPYIADQHLGEGVWGKVYKVHDQRAEDFALKVLKAETLDRGPGLESEVRVLARLSHPNLVRILEYLPRVEGLKGVAESGPGLLMEFIDGPDLTERRAADAPGEILPYFVQALRGLDYLHARRLTHGDLKPGNLKLHKKKQLKILDFGLAGREVEEAGGLRGTMDYMAPEALAGRRGAASDLFSLAAVFYEWLTGSLPFPRGELAQRFAEPSRPASELRPDTPPFFSAILQRMLDPDPARRFSSAGAVLRAIGLHQPKLLAGRGSDEGAVAAEARIPFVGHEELLAAWETSLRAWEDGEGKAPLWLLRGPAGIGRSRCLDEMQWQAALREYRVLGWTPGESLDDLTALAAAEPGRTLLVLKELHDLPAEAGTILENFFASLPARVPQAAVAMECDPDRISPGLWRRLELLSGRWSFRETELQPLNPEESARFLQEQLWERPLPAKFLAAAHEATRGSPALLAEVARWRRGQEAAGERRPRLEDFEPNELPPSQQESLKARWFRLTAEERELLGACSLLAEGLAEEELSLFLSREAGFELEELAAKGWIERQGGPYRVTPPLARRPLLGLLSSKERQRLAERVFEALRGHPGAAAFALARLAREAGRTEDYLHYGARAAEEFQARGDAESAARLHRDLSEAATAPRDQSFHLAYLASALSRLARFEEAHQAYERWYALVEDDGTGGKALKYHYLIGLNFLNQGKPVQAGRHLRQALQSGDPKRFEAHRPFYLKVLTLLGKMEEQEGRRAEARRRYEEGLALAAEPSSEKTQLLRHLGLLELAEGKNEVGRAALEAALQMSLDLEYDEGVANCAAVLADLAHKEGDYERALRIHEQVMRLAEKHQDPLKQARTHSNMASVLIELADYGHAAEHAEKAQAVFAAQGTELDRLVNRFHLATLKTYLGQFQEAQDAELQESVRRLGQGEILAYLERLRGEAARLQRDFQGALQSYGRAREGFLAAKNREEAELCLLQEIFTECLTGDLEAAQRRARAAKRGGAWESFFAWIDGLLTADTRDSEVELQEALRPILKCGQQELVILALLAASELHSRRKETAGAEFFRQKAFEWLEALYRALPEEMQLSFEQREDYRRLAEARLKRLKAAGISRERFLSFAKINKRLSEETDMHSILEQVMDAAMALAGAERGFLLIREEARAGQILSGFRVEAARNMKKENLHEEEFKISLSVVEEALRRRVSLLTDDAQADPSFRHAESVVRYELKSILVLPLVGATGCLGALYLDHRFEVGAFSEEKLLFLKAFADQSVLAIEKARTLAELADAKRRLEHRVEEQAQRLERMEIELKEARKDLKFRYEEIVGQSPKMMKILGLLDRVTDTRVPVWIHGESGTGKELIARALHFNSDRKSKPFIAENCSAIPENLLESVLFGHVKGAFTHAERDRMGLFEAADGGTIFLDEIGDMPMPMQAKLLRVLQEGEVRRVGANKSVKVDVRVVSATNKNLPEMVKRGEFREDLFFRLNGLRIELPPLRERKEDIPLLVQHFMHKLATENGLTLGGVSEQALGILANYDWPGNIRELENALRNAAIFAEGKTITSEMLGFKPELWRPSEAKAAAPHVAAGTAAEKPLQAEREAILDAMVRAAFHKGEAAKELHITPRHLYNLLEKYRLPKNKWALKKLVEEERS
ncbi:MAG: sigma 54-interacting transcriptional regulator [Deltaproteobacteria bacterium]|nr:sigma 54-interacting transcriptional regulator [Deltaproteobacteria bacterium]